MHHAVFSGWQSPTVIPTRELVQETFQDQRSFKLRTIAMIGLTPWSYVLIALVVLVFVIACIYRKRILGTIMKRTHDVMMRRSGERSYDYINEASPVLEHSAPYQAPHLLTSEPIWVKGCRPPYQTFNWSCNVCNAPPPPPKLEAYPEEAHRPVGAEAHRPVGAEAHWPVGAEAHWPVGAEAHWPAGVEAHWPPRGEATACSHSSPCQFRQYPSSAPSRGATSEADVTNVAKSAV
ncbi:uncharacterized protein [Panulirus ornatus]|uniref:uncharacterized protein n=1 Tax=Panulirus ornatus TaxID=150431 RepID=UPI003A89B2CA